MPKIGIALLIIIAIGAGSAQRAAAIPFFLKVYLTEYKKDIESQKDKGFPEYVAKKAKCYICHQGKKKSHHNAYGEHLKPLLDKKKDKKDTKKVIAALKKVALLHNEPKNKKSPTYGELIKQGKLPGGKLEDAKKEPEKKAEAKPAATVGTAKE